MILDGSHYHHMTRCQIWGTIELHRTLFQKCSHSGINGSKHPMLSISMAYDVISCKKNPKKKMLTFPCRFCSQAQKLPKIYKKTLHSLLSPFLSLLKSYYVLITFITINVIIITGQRLYSVDVRRQCTSTTMGVTERCRY